MPVVPMEVAVAVSTGRTEFLKILKGRIAQKGGLTLEEGNGLIDLLQECIEGSERDRRRMLEFARTIKKVDDAQKGMAKVADELRALLKRVERDEPEVAEQSKRDE